MVMNTFFPSANSRMEGLEFISDQIQVPVSDIHLCHVARLDSPSSLTNYSKIVNLNDPIRRPAAAAASILIPPLFLHSRPEQSRQGGYGQGTGGRKTDSSGILQQQIFSTLKGILENSGSSARLPGL
jgi:hypothetical protein